MSIEMARLVRVKREQATQREKLFHLAKKTKLLAEEAFRMEEHIAGAKLLNVVEYLHQLAKVRES